MRPLLNGLLLGGVVDALFESTGYFIPMFRKYWDSPKLIYGYHIHHSTLGLLLVVIGIVVFLYQTSRSHDDENQNSVTKILFLIGFGMGLIIVHSIGDRNITFIECPSHNCPNLL